MIQNVLNELSDPVSLSMLTNLKDKNYEHEKENMRTKLSKKENIHKSFVGQIRPSCKQSVTILTNIHCIICM